MAATLIKLIAGNRTREFRPDNVDIIDLPDGDSVINISMVSGSVIKFETPSPTDALAKLTELEAAFTSGTGIVTITDDNSAVFVTTTTLEPTTSTTTCAPLTTGFNVDSGTGLLDFTVIDSLFTTATVTDPSSAVLNPADYVIYSVDNDTFIYGITFSGRYGNWTIRIGDCVYTINVTATTTTTSTTSTTTLPPTTSTTTI